MTKTAYRQTEDSEYNTRPDDKDSLQKDRGQWIQQTHTQMTKTHIRTHARMHTTKTAYRQTEEIETHACTHARTQTHTHADTHT